LHWARENRLWRMSLLELRQLRDDVQAVMNEIERAPERREIDIGAEFSGDPELVGEVLEAFGDKTSGKWQEILTLYCGRAHCESCPHGPYLFEYRRAKGTGKITFKFRGVCFLDPRDIRRCYQPLEPIRGGLVHVPSGKDLGGCDEGG
jgi:hypothetical protein